jgi:NAD-dependent SIR2 family protein deacetylase
MTKQILSWRCLWCEYKTETEDMNGIKWDDMHVPECPTCKKSMHLMSDRIKQEE